MLFVAPSAAALETSASRPLASPTNIDRPTRRRTAASVKRGTCRPTLTARSSRVNRNGSSSLDQRERTFAALVVAYAGPVGDGLPRALGPGPHAVGVGREVVEDERAVVD